MDSFTWCIEVIEIGKDEQECRGLLDGLSLQDGYLNGRILPWTPEKPQWRVQAFMHANGQTQGWLPDGCNYRIVPNSLLKETA